MKILVNFLLRLCYNSFAPAKLENSMEVKTREEELEELLSPGGELKAAVDRAVIKIRNETEPKLEDKWWEELDNAINKYMQYAIEHDRLKRKS